MCVPYALKWRYKLNTRIANKRADVKYQQSIELQKKTLHYIAGRNI